MVVLTIALPRSGVKRTTMQDSGIRNSCWREHHFCSYRRKSIYSWHTKNPQDDWQYTPCSNQEERRRDKTPAHKINIQSLMASVAESQVVDSTSIWYLSITKSRLTRPTIVTWCCYNSYCLPHVRSHIKFFMFHHDSRVTCCTAQGAVNFPTLTSSRQNDADRF